MNLQFTLAARYLWGRKLRTFLTTLAVIFGVLVIFGMNILLPTIIQSFQANMLAASGQVDVTITHKTGGIFSSAVLDEVRGVAGVRVATGLLNRTLNLPANFFDHNANPLDDKVTTLTLVGLDVDSARQLHTYPLEQGRFLQADDQEAALITTNLADLLALELGDRLTLPTPQGKVDLTIVGLLAPRVTPGNEEVSLTLTEAQTLLNHPNQINVIEANFDAADEAKRAEIEQAIQVRLGENFHLGGLPSGEELLTNLRTGRAAINMFGVLALFMGGFIIFNTFRTVVAERRRDVGMLRAIGANRRTIIGAILAEGLLQGGVGTLIGMAAGYLLGASATIGMSPMMEQFMHLKIGAPVVSPGLIVGSVVLGIGTTLLAGLLPALSASRVAPLDALQPTLTETIAQRAAGVGSILGAVVIVLAVLALFSGNVGLIAVGGLLFLGGLALIAPALVRPIARLFGAFIAWIFARQGTGLIAQGNLARQPTRAAVTASATMIGLAILVALGGMTTSIYSGFLGVFKKSLGGDYLFIPPAIAVWGSNVGAKQTLADELRAVPGVGVVSTMRYAAAAVNDQPLSLLGIDPLAFPEVGGLRFLDGDEKSAYRKLAADRTLIVNGPFASIGGIKVGDEVQVTTPEGKIPYRVVAIAGDYFNSKTATGYLSQANLEADFHRTEDIFISLNLSPDADEAAVDARLKAIIADYPQFRMISGKAYYIENKRTFDAAFAGFDVAMMVIAFPSLIAILNTLAIGVIERTREIGMLRAVGATQKQVRRMVIAEALLLAATGTAFGLLGGVYLGYVFVKALTATGYPLDYAFPLAGLLVAIAAGLLFGVLAAIVPARQAAKMEIVKALRYE
jgi:putative ABC transport system permease protein